MHTVYSAVQKDLPGLTGNILFLRAVKHENFISVDLIYSAKCEMTDVRM